jgi:lipid II:glycine glycyltransferase (peptidoglycan interpeptide bridge formation enzyme)
MSEVDGPRWESFLKCHPDAHLLQQTAWGDLKTGFGWRVRRVVTGEMGAQILLRPLGFSYWWGYLPRGPVVPPVDPTSGWDWSELWPEIDAICRSSGVVFLKVETDFWQTDTRAVASLAASGLRPSQHAIQPVRTLVVDLAGDETDLLGRMKSKTRYNIGLAQRKGVHVHPSSDVAAFHEMMVATGRRDAFGVHSLEYFQRVYDLFHPSGACELLVAEKDEAPLAGLMVFASGPRAWYFYGASGDENRALMPTYLLQWEAMRWARARGCLVYDLWGVPDADEIALEAQFTRRNDGLWGVYRFKRGFGGTLCRTVGAWDRVYSPALYGLYQLWSRRRLASHQA